MLNDWKMEKAVQHIIYFSIWMKDVTENRKMHFVQRLLCPLVHNTLYCCFKLQIGNFYSAIQVERHLNTALLQSEAARRKHRPDQASGYSHCLHSVLRSLRDKKFNLGHTSFSFALLVINPYPANVDNRVS
jgi:hypothetical protein